MPADQAQKIRAFPRRKLESAYFEACRAYALEKSARERLMEDVERLGKMLEAECRMSRELQNRLQLALENAVRVTPANDSATKV